MLVACASLTAASLSAQTCLVIHGLAVAEGNGPRSTLPQDGAGHAVRRTVIDVFGTTADDRSNPHGELLIGSDDMLYGTTENGHNGSELGTVYSASRRTARGSRRSAR
jgi:hypothetical protein